MFHNHEKDLKIISNEILEKVRSYCIFGSTNKVKFNESKRNFNFLIQAIDATLKNLRSKEIQDKICLKTLLTHEEVNATKNESIATKSKIRDIPFASKTTDFIYLSPQNLTDPNSSILNLINYYYNLKDKFNWNDDAVRNLRPFFANYLKFWHETENYKNQSRIEFAMGYINAKQQSSYQNLYSKGLRAETNAERSNFIEQTIYDVKNGPVYYAFGNCGLMADIAMLEAIARRVPYTITYIRFINDNNKIEELNAVALGDWPNKGCVVISPWQGENGISFIWQGSIESTPEIANYSYYNRTKVLFNVTVKQQASLASRLEREGFCEWLNLPKRSCNIELINQLYDNFCESLKTHGFANLEIPQQRAKLIK